jgi:pyruvate ferredoxin oxidoreductase gamma subunit
MKSILPDAGRFFEIRFESIGGLGAHAAGQILATAAVLRLGFNGAHFSSYGSEKKGSVIRSFVRLGPVNKPIRTSAPVEIPDAIVVFHAALLRHPATLAGLKAKGTLIYNAPQGFIPPELVQLPKSAACIQIDATKIASEEKSRPNAVLLGTLTTLFPFLKPEVVLKTLSEEFAHRHPEAVAANQRVFERGAKEYEKIDHIGERKKDVPTVRSTPVWGYETAPIGGLLPKPANTAWNNLSISRMGWMPIFQTERCIHCGVCDLVCPDLCLVWISEGDGKVPRKAHLLGIDYRYCKGCLRCVESCPTGALSKEAETPGLADQLRKALFPDLIP